MKILIVTDIDNPGLKEDCFIAKSFINDGHHVTIARQDYDERLDELYDIILIRNIWHLNADKYEDEKDNISKLLNRLRKKNILGINIYGKFDEYGKMYLKELYDKGYPVIPTGIKLEDFNFKGKYDKFLLKPIKGFDGFGIIECDKKKIVNNQNHIIQPKIKFKKEIEFYFLNNEFQYVLEFIPSKKPIYPIPSLYDYSESELKIAQTFASLCDKKFCGVQRIDFLKDENDKLLLLEIGDSAPYLNLNSLDEKTRNKFINNYKRMVYEYIDNLKELD